MRSQVVVVEPTTPIKQAIWVKKKTRRGTKTKMMQLTPEKKKRRAKSPVKSPTRDTALPAMDEDFLFVSEAPEPFRLPKKVFQLIQIIYKMLTHCQSQNDFLREWLPHKQGYLDVLLDSEAPPDLRICSICSGDGSYRCSDCFWRPMYCSSCCRQAHSNHLLHRVEQWNGTFFEESSLRLVSP